MKHILWIALALVACSKKNDNPTKSGTNILSWELKDAERASIRTAKTSDVKVQDVDYATKTTDGASIKLKVHLETATVVFTEDNKEVTHASPIKLGVTVVDGADYTLAPGKCMGPDYKLTAPGEAPRDMILFCTVKATKPNTEASFMIYTYGDGKIDDGDPKTQKVM